jgi:hypothetical protein
MFFYSSVWHFCKAIHTFSGILDILGWSLLLEPSDQVLELYVHILLTDCDRPAGTSYRPPQYGSTRVHTYPTVLLHCQQIATSGSHQLLEMEGTVNRLKCEIQLLEWMDKLKCNRCWVCIFCRVSCPVCHDGVDCLQQAWLVVCIVTASILAHKAQWFWAGVDCKT